MGFFKRDMLTLVVVCWLISTGLLAWTAFTARESADSAIAQIQTSRRQALTNECVAQNARNANTLATLSQIYAAAERAKPAQAAQLAASEQATVSIVNDLAPVHAPCSTYVAGELAGP